MSKSARSSPARLNCHGIAWLTLTKWDGPLPQSYIDGQHDLQKQILARERQLGMSPVLPAFAGHVPEALQSQAAGDEDRTHSSRAGRIFPPTTLLGSSTRWTRNSRKSRQDSCGNRPKEYGTSHYYGTDPFNEITPPSWEPSYLANVARAIYGGMAQVDPGRDLVADGLDV